MNINIDILVLTDTTYLSDLITTLLTQHGYNICGVVKNPREFFESYELLQPNIVILDLDISSSTNVSTNIINELLLLDKNALIIALGENITDDYKNNVLNSGAKEYLCKPFQPANLWERVGRTVKKYVIDEENKKTIKVARETINTKDDYLNLPKFNQSPRKYAFYVEESDFNEKTIPYKNDSTEDSHEDSHKTLMKPFFKKIIDFFSKTNKV